MFNSNLTLIALTGNFVFDQDVPFAYAAKDPDQLKLPDEPSLV